MSRTQTDLSIVQQYTPRDELDGKIKELALKGCTERKIAEELGTISNVAVHKRLAKMRAVCTADQEAAAHEG